MHFEGSAGRFPAGLDRKKEGGVRVTQDFGLRVKRGVPASPRGRTWGGAGLGTALEFGAC